MLKFLRLPGLFRPSVPMRFHSSILVENTVSNTNNRLRIPEELYAAELSTPFEPHVKTAMVELAQETVNKFGNAHMMVSESQAKVLHQLVHLFGASRILELGTFTGFSTLAMATALRANGKIISIEMDSKPHAVARQYVEKLKLQDRVDLRLGPAMDGLVSIAKNEPQRQFDLIFLDADKPGYIPYFDFIMDNDLLSDRGVIIADNVLFFGQVHRTAGFESDNPVEASKRILKVARALHEFNQHVLHDPRVQVVVLPLFDGVSLIRKNHS